MFIFLQLCLRVAKGDIEAGAAVVRPPGHHAEADSAMGFCLIMWLWLPMF